MLKDLNISHQQLFKLYLEVEAAAQLSDPLQQWYELMRFIAPARKGTLRDSALMGQLLLAMEHMLRMFLRDATGQEVHPSYDQPRLVDAQYGEGTARDELSTLEYLTKQFHINPRPRLSLLVEGKGEHEQFPSLVRKLCGLSFAQLGIEIINVQGIGNFEGKKRDRLSAWQRFIDDRQHHGTSVFLVFDREGAVVRLREELAKATSLYEPGRPLLPREHFHVWNTCIEFDNFSDEELARAMTVVAEARHTFHSTDLTECRERRQIAEKDELSALYRQVFNERYRLDKPELLRVLVDYAAEDPYDPWSPAVGPRRYRQIVQLLYRVIHAA